MRLSQLTDEETDLLLFIVAGINPATKPTDMAASNKGGARDAAREQHICKMSKHRGRLQHLTDELDNLPAVAMRMGYSPEWLSPELRAQYEAARLRGVPNDHHGRQAERPPAAERPVPALVAPAPPPAIPEVVPADRVLRRRTSLPIEDRRRPEGAAVPMVVAGPPAPREEAVGRPVVGWNLPALELPPLPGAGAVPAHAPAPPVVEEGGLEADVEEVFAGVEFEMGANSTGSDVD